MASASKNAIAGQPVANFHETPVGPAGMARNCFGTRIWAILKRLAANKHVKMALLACYLRATRVK
jgi:hypothetical protein